MTRPNKPAPSGPGAKDYEVGYGRPPAETQFKPGQSGNPKGRPKGSHRPIQTPFNAPFEDMLLEELYRRIPVNDGARRKNMPLIQAIFRSLSVSAAKGDFRSQKLIAEYVSRTEDKNKERLTEELKGAMEIKARQEHELERREKNNLPTDDLLPHPDDIFIDMHFGTAKFWGPLTKEDLRDLNNLLRGLKLQEEINTDLMQRMRAAKDKRERKEIAQKLRAALQNQIEIEEEINQRASPQCVRRILDS